MTSENTVVYGTARSPTSASLRRVIDAALLNDAALEAFCIDYFPWIKQRFSNGMERRVKVTLLLEQEDRVRVLAALQECCPQAMGRYGHLVRYELYRQEALQFSSNQEVTQPIRRGFLGWLNEFCETHGLLIMWMMVGGFYGLMTLFSWASQRTH